MEDWQGCLSPLCQTALQDARRHVLDRGGQAITVEDFLLALIDCAPGLTDLLRRRGVDLDELTRTIQCEQPIVTVVHGEGLLSSQLLYWLSTARECLSGAWLEWPGLLRVLVSAADRLAGKAYVAVLEQVSAWPEHEAMDPHDKSAAGAEPSACPVVMTEPAWLQLAEDLAVRLAACPTALIWLCGAAGSGKTTWLQALAPSLQTGFVVLDLRREAEVMASDAAVFPAGSAETPPVLILDNVSPEDLYTLCRDPESVARQIVPPHRGPILLLSPPVRDTRFPELESWLGRRLERVSMPQAGAFQIQAILTAHQARIERQSGVELNDRTLRYAGSASALAGLTPGQAIEWVTRAAVRVALLAERGSAVRHRLAGELDTLNRQLLIAVARDQPVEPIEQAVNALSIEQAALEVDWHERRTSGTLRQVTVADLDYERARWQPTDIQNPGSSINSGTCRI